MGSYDIQSDVMKRASLGHVHVTSLDLRVVAMKISQWQMP